LEEILKRPAAGQVNANATSCFADARNPDGILRAGHSGSVQALAFSSDGRWLASGGYDKVIIVWNLSSGREEFRLGGHKNATTPLQQSLEKEAISGDQFVQADFPVLIRSCVKNR
jgi:WD40 repeat protein